MGNLNFETTQGDIQDLFNQAGSVVNVALPTDRDTGRPRGFAFIEFADETSAMNAIDMFDGAEFDGRALRVNLAQEQQNRSRGYGSNSGSGYSGGPKGGFKHGKPKGSRRHIRAQKRGY